MPFYPNLTNVVVVDFFIKQCICRRKVLFAFTSRHHRWSSVAVKEQREFEGDHY